MTTKKDKRSIEIIGFLIIIVSIIAFISSFYFSFNELGLSIISPYVFVSIVLLFSGIVISILGFVLPLTPERQR